MATLTDEMDAVAEPVRAKDELKEPEELKDELKEQLPLTEPSPSHIETKIEQVEDAIEISASPAIQTPVAQIPAHQESAERSFVSKQASDSLHDRPASVDHTTPSKANSAYTASIITDQQEDGTIHNDDNNEELTPPPDSPVEDPMSRASSVPLNTLEDEIVVGTNANHNKPPSFRITPENEDVVMADVEEKPPTGQQSKRKRISAVYADSVGDKDDSPAPSESQEARRPGRPPKAHGLGAVKAVVLGFWRDSPPENDADKHGVIGFIDVRDRLRTRIQPTTRDGRPVDQRYPIPPGPGGSWVTFDKVAFDNHLAGLNHHVVKEYVKIRVDDGRQGETPEEQAQLEREAAELATERVRNNPPPEAATQPLIAYGAVIPDNAVFPNRPETKKRRLAGSFGAPSNSPGHAQQLSIGEIPGTRPTKIPVGYWKKSSEKEFMDKHVVMGILGANDMFRVKVTRETRDGRAVNGNFPTGAGAIWIPWDEVEWDPQLRNLSRAEIKEYTRVRQRQIDLGESPDERIANETAAVIQGQQRVAQMIALGGVPLLKEDPDLPAIAMKGVATTNGNSNANGHKPTNSPASTPIAAKPDQPNQAQRSENNTRAGRRPLPDIEFRAANRAPPAPGVLERTNSLARREIARVEAAQARADLRAASREASLGPATTANNKSIFQDNVSRLNKVWAAQEANRIRAGGEDAKMYMGVKYERKQTGPFEGKLVSQGTIISIDGEDYVEYRVLTKPTFF